MTNIIQRIKDGLTGLFPSTRRTQCEADCEQLKAVHEFTQADKQFEEMYFNLPENKPKFPEYKITVDYGIPYDIQCMDASELETELRKLRDLSDEDIYPHFDVHVYDHMDKDITETPAIQELIEELIEETYPAEQKFTKEKAESQQAPGPTSSTTDYEGVSPGSQK